MARTKNSNARIGSKTEEDENGDAMLAPHDLIEPKAVSAKTLAGMDQAIHNFKLGVVSEPVDLSDF